MAPYWHRVGTVLSTVLAPYWHRVEHRVGTVLAPCWAPYWHRVGTVLEFSIVLQLKEIEFMPKTRENGLF